MHIKLKSLNAKLNLSNKKKESIKTPYLHNLLFIRFYLGLSFVVINLELLRLIDILSYR